MSRNRRSLELPLTDDCGLPRAPAGTVSEAETRSKPSVSAVPHTNGRAGKVTLYGGGRRQGRLPT